MINKAIKHIGDNFGNPQGITGILMCKIMNIMNQKLYSTILDNIRLEPNNIVLDIGFGNGYLIKKLLKKHFSPTIYGIEISGDMANFVSKKYKKYINTGQLTLLLENIEKTSFENKMFDRIITINTVYFWNDYEKCFSEINRILKYGGIFFNVIYSKDFLDRIIYTKYGFKKNTFDEILNITKENGMKIIKTLEIEKNKSFCIISENKK
jgi:ubiquinone/menaquinone biosynthesis C-methylase UbiE